MAISGSPEGSVSSAFRPQDSLYDYKSIDKDYLTST